MAMIDSLFVELGIIIAAATIGAYGARLLRQPLIIGYLLSGVVIGPQVLQLVSYEDVTSVFAELGIAFLLFIVGLELDVRKLRTVGSAALTLGLIQTLFIFGLGFFLAFFLGFGSLPSIYIGLMLAFSSTAIVIKLFTDKNEIDSLHGRLILGILLVQDILVVIALSVLHTLDAFTMTVLATSLVQGIGLVVFAVLLSQYVIPSILRRVEHTPELVLLVSISTLFAFVSLSTVLGFSSAIGGLIAGLSLSTFPYNVEIMTRAKSLRDFFVAIFFASLGMIVDFAGLQALAGPFLLFVLVAMVLKPLFLSLMTRLHNYGSGTAFTTGFGLGQISEFSIVIASTGLSLGHIDEQIFSISAALLVVTALASTYFITYHQRLNMWLLRSLYRQVERSAVDKETAHIPQHLQNHTIVLGLHERGRQVLEYLQEKGETVVGVDYNPDLVRYLHTSSLYCVYGDARNPDVLSHVQYSHASLIVSTLPSHEANMHLLNAVRSHESPPYIVVSADNPHDALELYSSGANYVIYDKMVAGQMLVNIVSLVDADASELSEAREQHIHMLEQRLAEEERYTDTPAFLKRRSRH